MEFKPIFRIVGALLLGLAATMLIPAAADAVQDNPDWIPFVLSAAITAFVGGLLVLATLSPDPLRLDIRQTFLLTAACWIIVPSFSALPFIGLGHGYTDAFFEAMSGMTTTGSTVFTGLDTFPVGVLLWRALLQWAGGVGIIVMAIVMLPYLRVGGMQLFRTESSGESEKIAASAFHMTAWILGVYTALTLLCAVLFGLEGMTPFDAVCHAMTTLSTGGYSNHDASFGFFPSPAAQWTGTLFMILGALPFVAYIKQMKGHRRALIDDPQIRGFVLFLTLTILLLSVWLENARGVEFLTALRLVAFNVVSVVTTTGFASEDYGSWGAAAVGAFFMLTFVGGCAGSTSGAIKIYRFQVLRIVVRAHVLKLISPHRVVPMSYGGKALGTDVPTSVLAFLAVFLGTVAMFSVVLSAMGLDLVTAVTASATAITNVGPGLGPIIGPAGNFATLPDAAKWILALAMMMGRLEVFTVLILFNRDFWRA
ncbi:TrkH family potassium uptake protein [Magnetospira thiophila]